MIAPTSSASKTNSAMSGWPVERPSASASASPSILKLRESVRNGGAFGCGLAPLRPTAWQRAQLAVSNDSPRRTGVLASSANPRGAMPIVSKPRSKEPSIAPRMADRFEQPIPQQGLFHDRHTRFFGLVAQRQTGLARNQDRGRRKVPVAQLRDEVQPAARWNLFVDNQTIATGQFARGKQFRSAGIAADGQAFKLEPEFEGISNGEVIADDDDEKARARQFVLMRHCYAAPDRVGC